MKPFKLSYRASFHTALVALALFVVFGGSIAKAAQQINFSLYTEKDWFFFAQYEYNHEENYEPAPHKMTGTIPKVITDFNGKKVRLYGFLRPLDLQDGYATHAIFIATVDVCGYGVNPRINEFMEVTTVPGVKWKVPPNIGLDPTGTVYGTFSIEEIINKDDNTVTTLYHILADGITG